MADTLKNLPISAVATAPIPAASGNSLVVTAGQGARFPTADFYATVCPAGALPDPANAEIVRVTSRSTDTMMITRAAGAGTSARTILVGDQFFQCLPAEYFDQSKLVSGAFRGYVRFLDTNATGFGYWDVVASDFYDQGGTGVHNHTLGIAFNEDASVASLPCWSENWEPRYVPGAPPLGLLEKNWSYTSIDRLTTYRPLNFAVDLNTHAAYCQWNVTDWSCRNQAGAGGGDMTAYFLPAVQLAGFPGEVLIGTYSGGAQTDAVLKVTGSATDHGTQLVRLSLAGTFTSGDTIIRTDTPAVTGDVLVYNHEGSATGMNSKVLRNTGAGGSRDMVWSGSSGDAWSLYTVGVGGTTHWSVGCDNSDSDKFKIGSSYELGLSDVLVIDTSGNAVLTGNFTMGAKYQQLSEMTAPSAGAANTVRLYAEDNGSGKTRLMALFSSGAAQQVAIEP